jgi:AcrR family transcriptional regulator
MNENNKSSGTPRCSLHLSTSGRSFSSISLREVAREVGLVPTAFYRHFQDMEALGQELVDQVALHLKQRFINWGKVIYNIVVC